MKHKFLLTIVFILLFPIISYGETITYTVEQHSPDAGFQQLEYKSYPGPVEGILSNSSIWTGFFRQDGRAITVDLGEKKKINSISLEFQQNKSSGIVFPRFMEAAISLDGQQWSYLGRVNHLIDASDRKLHTGNLMLTFLPIEARYVKISFPVDVWVFARNLTITEYQGNIANESPIILAQEKDFQDNRSQYLKIPAVDNILLLYTGAHDQLGIWQKEDLMPLVSYIDEEGNVKDKFFDTFLFLPFPEVSSTEESWEHYLKGLFAKDEQLDALNQVSETMGYICPEYNIRPKVILTIPYPDPNQEQFSDHVSFSANQVGNKEALENRQKAIATYYKELISSWETAQFTAIDLVGIYWYKETIDVTIPDETRLVRYAAYLVHEQGQKFYWIPYFGSKGYENWQEYGFDYVILQPNFYANEKPPEERMDNVAQLASQYHLGVELEIDDKALNNRFYYDLFYRQLHKALELGLDKQATNAYYMGTKSILNASKSPIESVRKIYDDIYLWTSGQLGEK